MNQALSFFRILLIIVVGNLPTISICPISASDDSLRIKVYLEGPLINNFGALSPAGKPLMRDNLRKSLFTNLRYLPGKSPYAFIPFFADNIDRFGPVGIQNDVVTDSVNVFNVTGQNAVVDWVYVEVRSMNNSGHVIGTRSALVQRDGDIVDVDGTSPLFMPLSDTLGYIVVKHRNHLALMSQLVDLDQLLDLTSPSTPVYDYGTYFPGIDYTGLAHNKTVKPGYRAMWAGDFDANGIVKAGNPADDMNDLFYGVIIHPNNATNASNFDNGYGYLPMDYNLDGKVKFENPNDDKNMHFVQIFLYPLNTSLLENYGRFIEQVPPVTLR